LRGQNATGTLRRECRRCERTYTPTPKHHGYALDVRRQALKLYVDGTNLTEVAAEVLELDKLHTFVSEKKSQPTC